MKPVRACFPWEECERDFLVESRMRGISHKIIAFELQRTPQAVKDMAGKLHEEGLLP